MARTISLPAEKKVVLVAEQSIISKNVMINSITDDGTKVFANVTMLGTETHLDNTMTLWEGTDYENIGQWTDADVDQRIIDLLK